MHSAKRITAKYLTSIILSIGFSLVAFSQENSPYSRYGLGDLVPGQNILSRGMGGITAGYADFQMVNFINPASYGNLSYIDKATLLRSPGAQRNVIFDLGVEADVRTLKSISPADKFSLTNLVPSYLQLGIPIKMKKLNKKGVFWGMNIGLRPLSKINYKIEKKERLSGIDSLFTLYEGSGGLNQAYIGNGFRIKSFSVGFNAGYTFGNKDYSTRLSFINDTVIYQQSNSASQTTIGGTFINFGIQYEKVFHNKSTLRLGAYGSTKQHLKGSQDIIRETVSYDANGTPYRIDSVYQKNSSGTIITPSTIGIGFIFQDSSQRWLFGADFETTQWKDYRFYNQPDQVQNSWKVRAGAEYFPARLNTPLKKYLSFVKYRAGFYYGTDYVKVTNNLPEYGFTFGAGFPLKLRRGYYDYQSSILNTAIEIGSRGNKQTNLRENIFRISIGLSIGDLWFRRAKYD